VGRILSIAYLVVRFADLAVRGVLPLAFSGRAAAVMFWIETVLFAAPIFLAWGEAARRRPDRLFLAAMSMAFAGILYRLDAYLVAYDTGAGWTYFPSMGELLVSIGIVAFEILAFIVVVRLLPVLPKIEPLTPAKAE
jgi:Ni/Fe-hydrogenase subunit HybB-like protein